MNADYTLVERLPSAAEYNRLRTLVGWGPYQENVIEKSLPHSLYCLCALQGKQLVGMARVIGDAGLVYYIQDVIVAPDHQRRGIGTRLMDKAITRTPATTRSSASCRPRAKSHSTCAMALPCGPTTPLAPE